jgi:hypothetical protein
MGNSELSGWNDGLLNIQQFYGIFLFRISCIADKKKEEKVRVTFRL